MTQKGPRQDLEPEALIESGIYHERLAKLEAPGQKDVFMPKIYDLWMEEEGIPVHRAIAGVEDVTELPRKPWARMGGYGTFIEIEGPRQMGEGVYVVEIPSGGALEPEKHLYDEVLYILRGRGLTEVWQDGQSKRSFEWNEGALFAVPTNAWHRLVNGGREPVLVFGKTTAPALMNAFRNNDFIFNCDYKFTDRYTGDDSYFAATNKEPKKPGVRAPWVTNFVPDVHSILTESGKVEARKGTNFRMASWEHNHTTAWPSGRYIVAHYHYPGAVLLCLKGQGFALIWPSRYGIHPYQDGYGDKVIKMHWKPGSIYSPFGPFGKIGDSFHQHFNTGPEPALHLALQNPTDDRRPAILANGRDLRRGSIREGGRNIEYEDEDPEIRRMFEEELKQNGVECTMEPVVYRTDPIPPHLREW